MADSYSKLGTAGVVLVDNEYTPTDGSVDNAQNAELLQDVEQGGQPSLSKRGGITPLGTVFASGVFEMHQLRFVAEI